MHTMAMAVVTMLMSPSSKPNTPAPTYCFCKLPSSLTTASDNNSVVLLAINNRRSWRCRSTAVTAREEEEGWRSYLVPEKLEVFRQLEPWVEEQMLPLLKPVEDSWQPSDLLPDPAALGADGFHAACADLRAGAARVPDDLLVCLVGNMVTEEALPTYPSVLNRFAAVRDATGADAAPWARWIRGWSAEENRHGDVLNHYMRLSARFDMRAVERAVHRLVRDGMVMRAPASPFHGFVYVAFQERATAVAHGSTARLAGAAGDAALARVCGTVAADEKRHEAAYTRVVAKLFDADPDAAVRAMAYMMRHGIDMPTALISDGRSSDFYARFMAITAQAGTYTVSDYRSILEHLMRQWGVQDLAAGLSDEGRRARDYLCELPDKIRRMEERAQDRARAVAAQNKPTPIPISWIFDRVINVHLP